jgi:hypothetical protein
LGDRERLGSGSGPLDHPACHALLGASIAGPDPLGLAFWGRPSMAISWVAGSAPSSSKGPSLGSPLSDSRPNFRELVGFGVRRPSVRRLGGQVLCLGSQRSPRGCRGASLSVAMAASGHVSSTDTLSRGLKAHGSSCLVEELWRALPCRPTLFGRWDVGPRGVDLAEKEPWHLVHVDLGR